MDLSGIPKLSYRSRLMDAYHVVTGKNKIPANETFFTLAGPNAEAEHSELNQLTGRKFINKKQYVSAERKQDIHNANSRIKGPTWIRGQLQHALGKYFDTPNHRPIAFLHGDFMSGIDKALPVINQVVEAIYAHNKTPSSGLILLAFNIVQSYRWAENQGARFSPAEKTMNENYVFQHMVREWKIKLVDTFDYANKTVGKGKGISVMRTLIFSMPQP